MRVNSFIKHIALCVLIAFSAHVLSPNLTLVFASENKNTEAQATQLRQRAETILKFLALAQLQPTPHASGSAFRSLFKTTDQTQKEYLRTELEALVPALPADLGSKAVGKVKLFRKARVFAWGIILFIAMNVGWEVHRQAQVNKALAPLDLLLLGKDVRDDWPDDRIARDRDAPMIPTYEIVAFSKDPKYMDWYFDYYKNLFQLDADFRRRFRENLMTESQLESAKREVEAVDQDGYRPFRFIQKTQVVENYINGLAEKRRRLQEKQSDYNQYIFVAIDLVSVLCALAIGSRLKDSKAKLKTYLDEEALYEENLWSIIRAKYPELPKGHQAALEWLRNQVTLRLAELLREENVAEVVELAATERAKECARVSADPNWGKSAAEEKSKPTAADTEAKQTAEAQADEEADALNPQARRTAGGR